MKNQWGHWYLYDVSLGPEEQVEQVTKALLTELDLQASEGISEDVLQAGTWSALMTLLWCDEGEQGIADFLQELR